MGNKISKKMTNSTTLMCVFSIIALFFGAVGAAFDPLATLIHNAVFKHDVDAMFLNFSDSLTKVTMYFTIYGSAVFMAVLAFVVMILMFKNKDKKNLSSSTASLIIFSTLAALPLPIVGMINELKTNISTIKSNFTDQTIFMRVSLLLVYCIPLISGFFLLLAGLCLALRLSGETYTVEVERVEKAVPDRFNQQPVPNQFAQPDMNSFRQPAPFVPQPSAAPEAASVQSEPAVCPHCGAPLKSPDAKFCSACGQKV